MTNYLLITSRATLENKMWELLDAVTAKAKKRFSVFEFDFDHRPGTYQKDRGVIPVVVTDEIDLELISYFLEKRKKNSEYFITFFVIFDYSRIKKSEMEYFEKNIEQMNKYDMYLVVCSEKSVSSPFLNQHFDVAK